MENIGVFYTFEWLTSHDFYFVSPLFRYFFPHLTASGLTEIKHSELHWEKKKTKKTTNYTKSLRYQEFYK